MERRKGRYFTGANLRQLENDADFSSKDPGPEDPALVHPRGVIHVNTFTTVFRCQVSVSGVSGVPN